MKEVIESALLDLGIPLYYVERPQGCNYCIVYTYKEYVSASADGDEEQIKYDVYFNLITTKNINRDVNNIKTALKEHGFRKITVNSPIKFDKLDYYQITMNYTRIINN